MNMHTYNALSTVDLLAGGAGDGGGPLDHLGMGLGCWIDDRTNGMGVTAESAAQRIATR